MVSGKLKKSDRFLEPVAKGLARAGITPNSLTVLGLVITIIGGYYLYLGDIFLGCFIILVGGVADILDGLVARHTGSASTAGAFLDSLLDRISDTVIFVSVILGAHIEEFLDLPGLLWGLGALTGALLTSYVRALSEAKGVQMKGRGLIERPERLIIFCLAGLLGFLTWGIVILAILGWVTVVQRSYHFYKTNRNK